MALPKIVVCGKKVILLSGYSKAEGPVRESVGAAYKDVIVSAEDKLMAAAKRDPDAVAFGYVAGMWVASA